MKTNLALVAAALLVGFGPARADDHERFPLSPAYQEECGSCHVAYPPRLLPAQSWQAVMAGLDKHFGSDASLDAVKAKEIGGYLAANAGRSERLAAPGANGGVNLKITDTPWFKRKHRDGHDGLSAAVWKSAAVKSPANCAACHRQAAAGDYSEGNIRIPRGN
ncbi:MAG TPA: diheme cytochrome c [Rhodocyclaceae bacterium]|nr:diheme cytochrome c [Rhodocyclaceae bacterium]